MILKLIGRGALLILGLMILGLSLIKASFTIAAKEGVEEIKKDEVNFVMTDAFGNKETAVYRLPEVGMLPDSMFYGFKRIRDYLWLGLGKGIEKPKMSLLMADKKVTEYRQLTRNGKHTLAIEAGNEAIDKLKYTNDLISATKLQNTATKELRRQIFQAGLAYREVFKMSESEFDVDQEKYRQLISRTDDWNQEQEKNRFEWDR